MKHDSPLAATRAFFAARAAGWETRFPDDGPVYVRAVREMDLGPGATVLDAGCGTGRALVPLREAVGPAGQVIGLDLTDEMVAEAVRLGRRAIGVLVLGDGHRLPVRNGALDAVFAAGFLPHLSDPAAGLRELARVVRPGGRLALFHPISRAALAARHGDVPGPHDFMAPARLTPALARSGWRLDSLDDGDQRFLALATRRSG
jgi:SAM-dependent methyltransferase